MTKINATKAALATEVGLLKAAAFNPSAARFTGKVTCWTDAGSGDVVGLQFGADPALCSTAGTARSFVVPSDG